MKDEKIVALRVHQSVVFNGTHVSNFTERGSAGKAPADMTIVPELNCVLIEDRNDRALVPFVNIAYMKLNSKLHLEKEEFRKTEESKPKNNPKLNAVKRPR